VTLEALRDVRDRVLPMLELTADNYQHHGPLGYPNVVDNVEVGTVGLEIEPSYAIYFASDGQGLFVEIYRRSHRTDNRAGGGYQKYGGQPVYDRRPLSPHVTDQELRNLVAELMSHFNMQPGLIHITDD
jgi:hypothetical protein